MQSPAPHAAVQTGGWLTWKQLCQKKKNNQPTKQKTTWGGLSQQQLEHEPVVCLQSNSAVANMSIDSHQVGRSDFTPLSIWHLWGHFWSPCNFSPQDNNDMDTLEHGQGGFQDGKGRKHTMHEERLRELCLLRLEKRRFEGILSKPT